MTVVLRLSNRGRYAVRALFDLAFLSGAAPRDDVAAGASHAQARDVAGRQRIPLRFLEQIFQELKRAGLVESKRGPRGGFRLARLPEEVRLGDVLRAVDGPVALAPVAAPRRHTARGERAETDMGEVTDAFLADVGRSVEHCFDVVTLRDLCARGEAVGLRSGNTHSSSPPPRWVI